VPIINPWNWRGLPTRPNIKRLRVVRLLSQRATARRFPSGTDRASLREFDNVRHAGAFPIHAGRKLSDQNSWHSRAEIGGDLQRRFSPVGLARANSDLSTRLSRRISGP
jgi:hypothetical protein